MNDTNSANAYLRTKVMTASPEELRLMLLDGSLKFANQAKTGLLNNDPEMTYSGFTQCRDIVLELLNTIKTEPAPQIAQSMRELYTFLYGELVKASIDKDIPKLDEVISLIQYDRETWVLTMEQVTKERESGVIGSTIPAPAAMPTRQPISFQA
ncbi:MAG: flagellar export chaperone FliS [Phycisphaerales bacterium]|jgi:flagellar protein FliS|nr:flagellar export chaperone FliS [Phycisphaerales bacterium]